MSNYYFNLLSQAQKLYRHNRQGSYKTRERYFEAYKRFLKFVDCEYQRKAFIRIYKLYAKYRVFCRHNQNRFSGNSILA